ncbi:beta-agarase [Pseudomonas sp. UL073]|uniref:Beta-agarase n=1 Tax=Zestomonas insulae TaxID=2809017 RepID=A0ABS2IBL5_9GAMM|nr:beta-agarase [Pseudomonas insulae]MBM7060504.1 beta-agarase [Pseudomonas insulae]
MIRRSLPALIALACAAPLWAGAAEQQLFNFVTPTDAAQVSLQNAALPQVNAETTADGEPLRRITFNAGDLSSVKLTPPNGQWDWSKAGAMNLRIQSAMDWAITLLIKVESADGKVLVSRVALPAGPAQDVIVPLWPTSPLAHGMRAAPPMPWNFKGKRTLLATTVEGALDPAKVVGVSLALERPQAAQSLLVSRIAVREGNDVEQAAYTGLVDSFGQSTRQQWPEKVNSTEQLKAAAAKEQAQLGKWLKEQPKLDTYGGLLDGPQFEASNFFRTEKRDGRWYLVTPEGHGFFSIGVNTVSPGHGATYVEGREGMFLDLPKEGDELAAYYGSGDSRSGTGANKGRAYDRGRWYDYYRANLSRIYGKPACPEVASAASTPSTPSEPSKPASNEPAKAPVVTVAVQPQVAPSANCKHPTFDMARWTRHSVDRLQAWGFNTLGNWSESELAPLKRMPYTIPLSIGGDYSTISTGLDWWGGIPDPFDPRFAMAAERAIAIAARDHRDDPWLLGYFADNELAWAGPGEGAQGRYALAYGTLRLTTDVPAKRAFLKQLRDKYRNQQGLSAAWGIDLPAWELMEDPGFQAPLPNPEHPAIEEDMQRFQRLFADTYFKTIADSLKWHSPNHMLLGGRFASSTPEAVASCAQYCDVVSFNFYTREPQQGYDFAALRQLDKPVLIGEFHFGSRDRGPFWGGLQEVYKEEERGPAYAKYLKQALAEPIVVGAHWFQYLDQPTTGRLLDGENGHFGLVSITDLPYTGFVDAVRKANLDVSKTLVANAAAAAKQAAAEQAAKPADGAAAPAPASPTPPANDKAKP